MNVKEMLWTAAIVLGVLLVVKNVPQLQAWF